MDSWDFLTIRPYCQQTDISHIPFVFEYLLWQGASHNPGWPEVSNPPALAYFFSYLRGEIPNLPLFNMMSFVNLSSMACIMLTYILILIFWKLYHEQVLNLVKYFVSINWDSHVGFCCCSSFCNCNGSCLMTVVWWATLVSLEQISFDHIF